MKTQTLVKRWANSFPTRRLEYHATVLSVYVLLGYLDQQRDYLRNGRYVQIRREEESILFVNIIKLKTNLSFLCIAINTLFQEMNFIEK